jgi:hypothetical protein
MSALENYMTALHRLIAGKPQNVQKGSAINKDTVALEAGRKRGSIKKSREEHAELIAAIEAASAAEQEASGPTAAQNAEKQKALKKAAQVQLGSFKENYESALMKIVSLVHENHMLKQRIRELEVSRDRENRVVSIERHGKS